MPVAVSMCDPLRAPELRTLAGIKYPGAGGGGRAPRPAHRDKRRYRAYWTAARPAPCASPRGSRCWVAACGVVTPDLGHLGSGSAAPGA